MVIIVAWFEKFRSGNSYLLDTLNTLEVGNSSVQAMLDIL